MYGEVPIKHRYGLEFNSRPRVSLVDESGCALRVAGTLHTVAGVGKSGP